MSGTDLEEFRFFRMLVLNGRFDALLQYLAPLASTMNAKLHGTALFMVRPSRHTALSGVIAVGSTATVS
jgi:hypothetical protein